MNASFLKTALHGVSAAVMQNAPAIAAGLAIVTGAVAIYKAAKCGGAAKEEIEKAKQAKRDEKVREYREAVAKLEESIRHTEEQIEQDIKKIQEEDVKLDKMETAKIVLRTMYKPLIWATVSAAFCIGGVVIAQKQIKGAAAAAAAATAVVSDQIKAQKSVLNPNQVDDVRERFYTQRAETALRNVTDERTQIIRTGRGDELFVEPVFTGCVFYSNVYSIRESIVRLNERLQAGERLSVNDYLDELGLPMPKHYNSTGFLYEPTMPSLSDTLTVDFFGSKDLITMPSGVVKSAIAVVLGNDPHDSYDEL